MGINNLKYPVVPHIPDPTLFTRERDRPVEGYPVKKSRIQLFKENYSDL